MIDPVEFVKVTSLMLESMKYLNTISFESSGFDVKRTSFVVAWFLA